MICVVSAGVCLAPRVSDGRRQWRPQAGQLLGRPRCNSRGSLEEREDGVEVGGRRGACSPSPQADVQRKGGARSSEQRALGNTPLLWQGPASWRRRVRLGVEETWTWGDWVCAYMEQSRQQPASCDPPTGPG